MGAKSSVTLATLALTGGVLLATVGGLLGEDAAATKAYEKWIDSHGLDRLRDYQSKPDSPHKLTILLFEPSEELSQMGVSPTFTALELKPDGHYRCFMVSPFSTHGGGNDSVLPESILAHLDERLLKLPEDDKKVPPEGRQVLVKAVVGDQTITRLYDRAKTPGLVWGLLREMKCPERPYVPELPCTEIFGDGRYETTGNYTAIAPGGELIFSGGNRPFRLWDLATHEMLREMPDIHSRDIAFSPDQHHAVLWDYQRGYYVDTKTWDIAPIPMPRTMRFTPDGRYLLSVSRAHEMEAYEVGTWKKTDLPAEIPADAAKYLPAPHQPLAVVELKNKALALWDTRQHRQIAALQEQGELIDAVFSPDASLVVMIYSNVRQNKFARSQHHIGLWRTDQGVLLHELKPYDEFVEGYLPESRGLVWTADGKYVLVENISNSFSQHGDISVFSTKSGRHLGQFKGTGWPSGFVLTPDGHQLIKGCSDGKIRIWDFPAAMRQVYDFEDVFFPEGAP